MKKTYLGSCHCGAVRFEADALRVVQENVPEVIPPEMCYLGWQDSLALLAKLVEPEIRQ